MMKPEGELDDVCTNRPSQYSCKTRGSFIGGSAQSFDIPGRKILMTLLDAGLYPNSTVLDIGCGCLRGGYWLIHFLDKGCYFGIEPDKEMLQAGVTILMEPEEIEKKDPKFDSNQDFDSLFFIKHLIFCCPLDLDDASNSRSVQCWMDFARLQPRTGYS